MDMTGKDWVALLLLAVVGGYGSMWLNFEGLRYVSAGLERVILFSLPNAGGGHERGISQNTPLRVASGLPW